MLDANNISFKQMRQKHTRAELVLIMPRITPIFAPLLPIIRVPEPRKIDDPKETNATNSAPKNDFNRLQPWTWGANISGDLSVSSCLSVKDLCEGCLSRQTPLSRHPYIPYPPSLAETAILLIWYRAYAKISKIWNAIAFFCRSDTDIDQNVVKAKFHVIM